MIPSTLTQYLVRELGAHPDKRDLVLIMSDFAAIGKYVSREVNRAGIADILGEHGSTNIQGERVQKLDYFANELCKSYLKQTGHFAALASEEEDQAVDMGQFGEHARYLVAFDPVDGSTNIDVNVSIGTIFSVHRRKDEFERTDERQFLQQGREQVLAGYVLYGSSTVLVFTFGDGVMEFTLDQSLGEFLLSQDHVTMPETGRIYSVNEANSRYFLPKDKLFVDMLKNSQESQARYIGSLVADFHRTLKKGGIFLYPKVDTKGSGTHAGKLRLNYELKPLAFIAEQAGGNATDGERDIMDIEPSSLHQRSAIAIGSKQLIQTYLES